MTAIHVDIESQSECDLKACGVYKYAEHPSTRITVLGYTFDGITVTLWIPVPITADIRAQVLARCEEKYKGAKFVRILNCSECPAELRDHIEAGGMFVAHNAQFERVVLNGVAGRALNFPKIEIEQTVCTAAKAAAHGLPRGLGDCAKALGTHNKDEGGRFDMLAVAKPRKPTKANPDKWWTPKNAPDKYVNLYCYNVDDVFAEFEIDEAVPALSEAEQKIYWLDQLINQRGVRVDVKKINEVQFLIDAYKEELAATCEKMTAEVIDLSGNEPVHGLRPTQREKIAEWIRANGWPQLEDLQAETVKQLVKNPDVPEPVKVMLKIYSTYNAKAVAKYPVMLEAACADDRLRGMFLYHGAGPGRWSALIVQLQNLFRPVIEDPEVAIEAFEAASLEWIRTLYPDTDPMKVFASCVRGMLIAADGCDLLFPDFAGIEARVNAWLWGEEWKLQAYRDYDAGPGPDLYVLAYAQMFGIPYDKVTKKQRQVGKVCLAGNTQVLCRSGWKRLDCVSVEDEVWDGVEWTRHGGLACNGSKPVVSLCEVSLTPDHLVWCGDSWQRADSLAASNESTCRALAIAAASLPLQGTYEQKPSKVCTVSSCSATAEQASIASSLATSSSSKQHGATCAPSQPAEPNDSGVMLLRCLKTSTEDVCLTDSLRPSPDAGAPAQSNGIATADVASRFANNGGWIGQLFSYTSEPLKDGTSPNLRWTDETTTEITSPATLDSSRDLRTCSTVDESTTLSKNALVYDLTSVGSRHRFLIWSCRGPLLVHNCELALGYEGGVGAFLTMVETYGIDLQELTNAALPTLPDDIREEAESFYEWMHLQGRTPPELSRETFIVCEALKRMWRRAHPRITQGWKDLKEAMERAVEHKGTTYTCADGKLMFRVTTYKERDWLQMRLPSGRKISYYKPMWTPPKTIVVEEPNPYGGVPIVKERTVPGEMRYYGIDTKTRQWKQVSTYGGRADENAVQGISACLLRDGMVALEEAGYKVLGSVHDEPITEIPKCWGSMEEASSLMCRQKSWCPDLPLAVGGRRAERYGK